ncbi:DUF6456 domain-containing protein [Aquabacter sp. P-9]|uniref:DUF6456 domain-containing protein n=1 Tax=Aquabacter sediminis TaxID=3029197 RepID=UPI00237E4220|nr:DUF6456 domain-containing protein [Aquabacter sp. P-9]MDE1567688.1 DUF6456 domain-containing protein [Aquabacter sp. P-9]
MTRRIPPAHRERAGGRRASPARTAARPVAAQRILLNGAEHEVEVDLAESPLAWLAQRKGRDGGALIDAAQLVAGERLRSDFTRAGLTPRVTTNWDPAGGAGPGQGGLAFSEQVLAAKGRLDRALQAVGPELSGVLLDVCCFLKGLEAVEQERGWPARTAKVVLGLGLSRLARHYGLAAAATGRPRSPLRAWRAGEAGAD